MTETGELTSHGSLDGDKLYQKRAREAFPILVRQAKANQSMFYSDLADEIGMPNPRNLNYILGTIGNALVELSKQWGSQIPPIQCLVINKNTGLPGEGIAWFLDPNDDPDIFRSKSKREKKQRVEVELTKVFNFPKWDEVLKNYNLEPDLNKPILVPSPIKRNRSFGESGESEDHKSLKDRISKCPVLFGLPKNTSADLEYQFPSADQIDVLFKNNNTWVGVEAKSALSDEQDIIRGLFQCVKYHALIEAEQKTMGISPNAKVYLGLEGPFPKSLLPIRNIIGVEVIDNIK